MARGFSSRISTRLGYTRQNLYRKLNPADPATINLTEIKRINDTITVLIEEDRMALKSIISK